MKIYIANDKQYTKIILNCIRHVVWLDGVFESMWYSSVLPHKHSTEDSHYVFVDMKTHAVPITNFNQKLIT